jgi:enoyl-CoA hydratase/carnithine racemase
VSLAIYHCRKPVIAALNGSAVGVGITMTLPCAIRVAPRTAKIGFVFARRGLVMEACSSFFLPRLVGASRAVALVTTGEVYPASSAPLDGLFTELVDEGAQVLPRALELAGVVAGRCSVVSVVAMRDMIFRGGASPEEAHLLESRILYDLFRGGDFAEGVSSFLDKREPRFKGTMEADAPSAWPWWEDKLKVKGPQPKL